MNIYRHLASWMLILFLAAPGYAKVMPVEFDTGRNRLIAYILSHQLPAQHYAHKTLENISPDAFDLYIKQLDPRKRFLLKDDIQQLQAFTNRIDDELRGGKIDLPDKGLNLVNKRIREVEIIAKELLDRGFDLDRKDYLEADPEKLDYATDKAEIHDRWRRILKLQIIETYLDFLEEEQKKDSQQEEEPQPKDTALAPTPFDEALWNKALTKVESRNQNYLHRLLKVNRQEHYNRYYDAVARAFDPHSNYMAPTSKQDFDIQMSGSLEGIGALLREDEGHIKVVRIIPGSAAERQGDLHAEDTILSVAEKDGDPVDITDMRIREAVSFIRGPKGTEVLLTVQKPDGSKKTIPIVRDVVRIEETYVKSETLNDAQGNKIGYIKIPSFYRDFAAQGNNSDARNVTRDTAKELRRLKDEKITGLILDLRNNGGGSLTDAVDVSGLFLPGGPVVQVKNSQGEIRMLEDIDKNILYDGPMIVMVNKFSASASEILAAALQDYERALIIGGDHTHGKGLVQALVDLNRNLPLLHRKKYQDLGALKVTIQQYYRINGDSTQKKGITPDLIVPTILDYLKSGEKYQDYSLPWDQVEKSTYDKWRKNPFDKKSAALLGSEWIAQSPEFKKIIQRTDKAKERSERTQIPVYLEGAMKERQELAELSDRDDNQAHMNTSPERQEPDQDTKKPLKEQLQEDPYVQLAAYLMSTPLVASTTTK